MSEIESPAVEGVKSSSWFPESVLISVLVLLVAIGFLLGWMSGNDRKGELISVSTSGHPISLDSADQPQVRISVQNLTDQAVQLQAIDAEAGCRVRLSAEELPRLLPPNSTIDLDVAFSMDGDLLHPVSTRESAIEAAFLPIVKDDDGQTWVTVQERERLITHRSMVVSRRSLLLSDQGMAENSPTVDNSCVLSLHDEVRLTNVRLQAWDAKDGQEAGQWVSASGLLKWEANPADEIRNVLWLKF